MAFTNPLKASFNTKEPDPLYPFLIHWIITTTIRIAPRNRPGTRPARSMSPTDSPDATAYSTISTLGGINGPNTPPAAWIAAA